MATISTPQTSPTTPIARQELAGGEPRRPGIMSPAGITMLVLLVVAFVALFFRWFVKQHQFSTGAMEDWGHVYLIPLVSGGLIWLKREKIFATTPRVFWPGIAPFVLGIVTYFFCVVGVPNHMLQGFAMILTIFGLTLLLLGPAMMRWLFLPIAYLGFGVTISEMIMNYLTFPLKLIASKGAGLILTFMGNLFDFGVEVDGNNITMTNRAGVQQPPLNVADACSGMRMVIAFVALAAAIALIRCRFWWQRVAVILLSIPVAVGLNVIRVAALGIASLFDQNLATGDAHMLIGTLLLIPGFFVFLGVVWVLERVVQDDDELAAKKPIKTQAAAKIRIPWPTWFSRPVEWAALSRGSFIVPLLVLALAAGGFGAGIRSAGIYLQKLPIYAPGNRAVREIPRVTASWEQIGNDRIESPEILKALGTENYVTRTFKERNPADPSNPAVIDLHIAYYTGMIDTVPHVPDRCFVGGGMDMIQASTITPIPLSSSDWIEDDTVPQGLRGRIFTANAFDERGRRIQRIRLPRDPKDLAMSVSRYRAPRGITLTAGYFFIANGGIVASAQGVRLLAFNLEDDYAYYTKVQVSSHRVTDGKELAELTARLMDELLPHIMMCVPDWIDVESGAYPADNPRRARPEAPPPA
jgi:exosortase